MAFMDSYGDATSRSCELSYHHAQQDSDTFLSAGSNDHGVATDFPQIPDVLAGPLFWYPGLSDHQGDSHGADGSVVHLGTPNHHIQYSNPLFQPSPTELSITGNFQQYTEMPQHQQMRYNESGDGNPGELAPVNQSQIGPNSFCNYHHFTPNTVTQVSETSMNEFHGPLYQPGFIQPRSVLSDFSRTATPMTINSPYSNSSIYASTPQSSQRDATLQTASFSGPLLQSPGGISEYERNRQKNRASAARFREKAQRYAEELREKERDLLSKKAFLTACVADLRDEALALKNEILKHAHCDCDHIQQYLRATASQVA